MTIKEKAISYVKQHPVKTSIIATLLIISLIIRLHASLTTPLYPGNTDPMHYDREVLKVFSEEGITDIYWPPGYPFFLVPFYAVFGQTFVTAKVVNTLLSLINAGIVYYLGKKLFNEKVGLLAFSWTLFDPLLTFYASNVYTETLFITLSTGVFALAFWQMEKPKWWKAGLIGVMIGFNALIKPWVLALIIIIAAWWALQKVDYKKAAIWTGLVIIGVVIALTPWTIRNLSATSHLVPVPVNGGLNFYLGNHEYGTIAFISTWPDETWAPFEGMDRYEQSREATRLAEEYVFANPGRFTGRIWQSFTQYWSHPNKYWYQRIVAHMNTLLAYLWVKWVLVIAGLAISVKYWRKHSANYLFFILMTAVFTTTVYLARFKVPLIPLQVIYASAGLMLIYNTIRPLVKQRGTPQTD